VDEGRLKRLVKRIGKNRLVLDLSCRRRGDEYVIVTDRWQTFTDEVISYPLLEYLSGYCHEFLIHAVDVEGKCLGIESRLIEFLGAWDRHPVTYAGGIRSMADIREIEQVGRGKINFTVGSALDIFGGRLAYKEITRLFPGDPG